MGVELSDAEVLLVVSWASTAHHMAYEDEAALIERLAPIVGDDPERVMHGRQPGRYADL